MALVQATKGCAAEFYSFVEHYGWDTIAMIILSRLHPGIKGYIISKNAMFYILH